jgi:hypothetical protein
MVTMRRRAFLSVAVLAALVAAVVAASSSTAAPAGAFAAELYAGQSTDVGDVYVWNDVTNLYVEIDLEGGWCMTESHVAAASTLTGIPQTSKGNPIPGQFAEGDTYSPCEAVGDTFVFPLAGLDADPVIAVHAKVWDPASETTLELVSDASTTVTSFNGTAQAPAAAVAAFEPVGYPNCGTYLQSPTPGSVWDTQNGGSASNDLGGPFAGATWIWPTANPMYPNAGEYATFERAFGLPGPPTGGSILITADNGYQVSLNGTFLGAAQIFAAFPGSLLEDGVKTTDWQSPESWVLPLQSGTNSLSIVAANEFAYPGDVPNQQTTGVGGVAGGVCPNPGGLVFKGHASYLADSESAWAGIAVGETDFPGSNWATYSTYDLQDVLLETVTVPATDPLGATSTTVLATGTAYRFEVTGTVTWTNRNGSDLVDAECTAEGGGAWAANAVGYPDALLELQVNGTDTDWDPVGVPNAAGCAPGNEYTLAFAGAGGTVSFRIYDGTGNVQEPAWFADNAGSLTVEIWRVF